MKQALVLFIACLIGMTAQAASYESHWRGDRLWIGHEFWANPLQDWSIEDGSLTALAANDRTLHLLTHQVAHESGDFEMTVHIRLANTHASGKWLLGGFRFGVRGELDGYRHALVHPIEWVDAGIGGDGVLMLNGESSEAKLEPLQWIELRLKAKSEGVMARLELSAKPLGGSESIKLETFVLADRLLGNIALLANGERQSNDRSSDPRWQFRKFSVEGTTISENLSHRFGPILWTQYTLSENTLKLMALLAPVEVSNKQVRLEIRRDGQWAEIGRESLEPLSRTAIFKVRDWDDTQDVPYRVMYQWQGAFFSWSGTIRKNPVDKETFTLAAFSCDNGYIFPNARIAANVAIQDPDMVFFAGDQIYEGFGGFGKTRSPVDLAMLDYHRKYWMFGWSWREILKDRPSVIIPDDHDVYQGNIWGHGGRKVPNMSDNPGGRDFPKGGYVMHPDWVNAVQRTQTGSLPDPVDPEPVEQGIGVYFTDIDYGGLSLAVIEDRKFKTGPYAIFGEDGDYRRTGKPADFDVEEAELLGSRQESFLKDWIREKADFKVVLSQTIFSKVSTHVGRGLNPNSINFDTNAWPQNKRNKALNILGSGVVMVHGDQHLGALVHQGVDDWEDGPISFMVPGTANGFPRAWWPEKRGGNHQAGEPDWTGRYLDHMGNRMTILAVANPEKGSNEIPRGAQDPESIGHQKGSGHGLITFNRKSGEVSFEMWRLQFDATDPKAEDQFPGFPKKMRL